MPENEIRLDSTTDSAAEVQAAVDAIQNTEPRLVEQIERPKGRGGFQRKLDKLTKIRREQEAALHERDREIERLRQFEVRDATATEAEPTPTAETSESPETPEQSQQRERDQRFVAEAHYRAQTSKQRMADAVGRYGEGFRQAITNGGHVSHEAFHTLKFFPNMPEMAFYLATHPRSLESLNRLSGPQVAAKLQQISETVALEIEDGTFSVGKSAERIRTKAPRPISPISGTGGRGSVDPSDPSISMEEYYAARSARRGR